MKKVTIYGLLAATILLLAVYVFTPKEPRDEQAELFVPPSFPKRYGAPYDSAATAPVEAFTTETDPCDLLMALFLNEADVPEAAREKFTAAVGGDNAAQEWINEYTRQNDDLAWSVAEIVYKYDSDNKENTCLYRIAMLYYSGNEKIGFLQDKARAYEWAKLSADKGNADAALRAGDMVRYGDGVAVDERAAFELYLTANDLGADGSTLERLGDCYAGGIGTAADIDNSGVEQVIHKGRLITDNKYYDDYYWVQIYEDSDLSNDPTPVVKPAFYDNHYGRHSGGNIYDLLPVNNRVIQFWTYEYSGATFCVTLQRHELLYVLQIFTINSGEAGLVSKSLFFDEAQNVNIKFS